MTQSVLCSTIIKNSIQGPICIECGALLNVNDKNNWIWLNNTWVHRHTIRKKNKNER